MTKIIYQDNPLKARVDLTEQDKLLIEKSLEVEELYDALFRLNRDKFGEIANQVEDSVNRFKVYLFSALEQGEAHCGDCTDVCTGCIKCNAEDMLGIFSLRGIRHPSFVAKAFSNCSNIDEAIKYLQDNPCESRWKGSDEYVGIWQAKQDQTVEDLIKYKEEKLNERDGIN